MDRYIGIDAHLHSCTVAVVGSSGKRLSLQVVAVNGEALRSHVQSIRGRRHICIEEGGLSEWLYEVLEPLAYDMVVTQPTKRRGSKSDAIDAWALADELRSGDIPRRVFKAPGRFTELRHAFRTYQAAQDDVRRIKHRIKAAYRMRGIAASPEVFEPLRRACWLELLPPPARKQTSMLSDELDRVVDFHEAAESWLIEEVKRTPDARILMSIPGIAHIRAATLLATVVVPHRFRTKRQFWNYCGLAVVTHSSSDWVNDAGHWIRKPIQRTRGLNRNGNPLLKDVFKGAAFLVSRSCKPEHPWRLSYVRQLDSGIRPNMALLTLARRIAATTLALWKRKELFSPQRVHCSIA